MKKTKKYNILNFHIDILKNLFNKPKQFHELGTHIITGYPGSGKTLLINHIINQVNKEKYFFLSNKNEFLQENVYYFDIQEIFNNNTQVKSFPLYDSKGRKLYGLIFDEINLEFNKRLNRRADYNNVFIGLIEFLVTHRHQGVDRVYFVGQKMELQDTQLQSLFKYWHDIIKCKKKYRYWHYKKYKYICKIPKNLLIYNHYKNIKDVFELDCRKINIKINHYDLTTYNTKALGEQYKSLPILKFNRTL